MERLDTILFPCEKSFVLLLRQRMEILWYNQDFPEETLSYNICDGFFFPSFSAKE